MKRVAEWCELCGQWRDPHETCVACGALEIEVAGKCELPPTDEVTVPDESEAYR